MYSKRRTTTTPGRKIQGQTAERNGARKREIEREKGKKRKRKRKEKVKTKNEEERRMEIEKERKRRKIGKCRAAMAYTFVRLVLTCTSILCA